MAMLPQTIDLLLLTVSELNELKTLCVERLKKNIFMTNATVGGKSFAATELVPTRELLAAISQELRRRQGKLITRTLPKFI